ncbi:MAG TPA: type II secretion system protein [Candidatus Hydrogenedentes bacterium]|nr:type II secretion system protein [Candidatus Hydrogenedentota bacterium]HPC15478.1 type II secretion system protein [Candidatus Hydrogenedentota bacterium]HRT20245.1 type II secretion system protein [Candidatus Hydrogenedentota bacterium]HRT64307.1 type II secretion system protein [Candidatus Hydrogenedentota bacterium]
MKSLSAKGFTLIELLTVIAIISILASMIFIVGPRMIERAKITSWTQTCNELRTTAVAFYTKKAVGVDTFPPAYGYLRQAVDESLQHEIGQGHDNDYFCLVPYVSPLKYMRNYDVYDPFGTRTHDTDMDGALSLLEFSLVGEKDVRTNQYVFSQEAKTLRYDGTNLSTEVERQLRGGADISPQRPMIYIPVNLAQTQLVYEYYAKIMYDNGELLAGAHATRWDPNETFPNSPDPSNPLKKLSFPPIRYDDFILISVGPGGDTGGIVTPMRVSNNARIAYTEEFLANVNKFHWYHVLALRAYYLATRDINDNKMLDFDYRNRTRSGEANPANYSNPDLCLLPNGTNGYGPLIYMPNKAASRP